MQVPRPRPVLLAGLLASLLALPAAAADLSLRVSADQRQLVRADGSAFFWLGDTAWELFHRLTREQADHYLNTRAQQAYTVIQAVAVAELDGINTPNPYGQKPFTQTDPSLVMNDAYFQHVDYIVDKAQALGMYVGLLPMWGSHTWIGADRAEAYGRYLGARYRGKAVIWVLGGDRPASGNETLWRAMARGIAVGVSGSEDYSRVLMTYHPPGSSKSSIWFHHDAWLDFNMQQNGHCANVDVWNRIQADWNLTPTKPVLDAEPLYESHPICFNAGTYGYSNATDIRKFAYWDIFAGAFGHTYGCHSVWQMYDVGRNPVNGPQQYWHQALTLPGATQMQHVRRLIESRPMLGRLPDQSVLASDAFSGGDRIQATRHADGGYAMVYSASGRGFSVNMAKLTGGTVSCHWYDPRSGVASGAGSFANSGTRAFTPPSSGYGNDWVLVLDDATRGYPPPGATGGNRPPSAQLTAPANGSTYAAPATIQLAASASDSDGSVVRVEFHAGGSKLGEDASAPYTFTWSGAPAGTHALSARAIDDDGASGGSNTVTVTVTTPGLVGGVNLGGGAVTVEGAPWRSFADARANGLATSAPNVATTSVAPSPATDGGTGSMLNSAIWGGSSFTVTQNLANGGYDVYLWVMENHQANYRRFDVRLEGATVASGVGDLALGAWRKYGPYRAAVADGRLDLELVKVTGDPHLMGLAIVAAGGGGGGSGSIRREWWTGVAGTAVSQIPQGSAPSGADQLTSFEAPIDWADDYGTRVRGWVHPPASGSYRLWISGDDNCELWLGTSDSAGSAQRIAHVPGWTGAREWGKYAEQQSVAISLVGGQRYWIEALQKEAGGGDSLAVAWEGPGFVRQVIAGAHLSPAGASQPGPAWSDGAVGSPGQAGSASLAGGTWTVRGGGADIWGASDAFHFVHQPLSGDGEITARVASQQDTDPWAKAGVMVRDGGAAGARHAMMVVTPGNGAAFQRRTVTGGASAHTAGSAARAPVWVRLVRSGDLISGYESGDGASWRLVGSATVPMGSGARIGLCVTSHNDGVLSTATFTDVTVVTGPSGSG